jgi:hypothetical protein
MFDIVKSKTGRRRVAGPIVRAVDPATECYTRPPVPVPFTAPASPSVGM